MTQQVQQYFREERIESLLFIGVGIATISFALYFLLRVKLPYYTGFAMALIAIAAIQLVVGSTVFFRSPKDIVRVERQIALSPKEITTQEIPRMNTVMRSFTTYMYVELALIATGLVLAIFMPHATFWRGIGTGLALQAVLMLGADFLAMQRGSNYLKWLLATFN